MATTTYLGCSWCGSTLGRLWASFDNPVTGLGLVTMVCRHCGRDAATVIKIRITEAEAA
jgi:hypothetical protein